MAFIKYSISKIASVGEFKEYLQENPGFKKIASDNNLFRPILLDPSRYIYVRNRAISAEEYWGPNDNGDAFPEAELRASFATFIGKPVSVDHKTGLLEIGLVIDSAYIEPTDSTNPLTGHYVQNIWAIDKVAADRVDKRIIPMLIEGKLTDSSMGVLVQRSECSVCGNIAKTEKDFCVHIARYKMQKIKTASGEKLAYERCFGLQFYEDSLIRPLWMGGLAGGRGADRRAKILELIVASVPKKAESEAEFTPEQKIHIPDTQGVRNPDNLVPEGVLEEKEKVYDLDGVEERKRSKTISTLPETKIEVSEADSVLKNMSKESLEKLIETLIRLKKSSLEIEEGDSDPIFIELFNSLVDDFMYRKIPFLFSLDRIYREYVSSNPDIDIMASVEQAETEKTPLGESEEAKEELEKPLEEGEGIEEQGEDISDIAESMLEDFFGGG